MGAVLLGIIEGHPLLQVRSGQRQLSQVEQSGLPQRAVGRQKERGVLDTLGQGEELLPQLPRRLELRPHQ